MSVSNRFIDNVIQGYNDLGLTPPARIGVAVSGGADSVALLLASVKAGFNVVPMHCNFQLRGDESERDERFVVDLCRTLGISGNLSRIRFDVDERRRHTGESVEMACRELRYAWFEVQRRTLALEGVAIAHNSDDDAETLLLNVMRGSGLRGLAGMPRSRKGIVRPMIGCSRKFVEDFLEAEGISFITDSSNLTCDYMRNRVRHLVIPAMEQANSSARKGMATTIRCLQGDMALLNSLVSEKLRELTLPDGSIDLMPLTQHPCGVTLLFNMLRNENWIGDEVSYTTAGEILAAASHSGARFPTSRTEGYEVHSGHLHRYSGSEALEVNIPLRSLIENKALGCHLPLPLTAEILPASDFNPDRSGATLWLNIGILDEDEPLTLRRWQPGDRMEPFGMRGSRLLSDIFSDAKLPRNAKEQRWVLALGDKIIWIPGMRCSRHFPVRSHDKQIIKISLLSSN